jgi:hypothetical protein
MMSLRLLMEGDYFVTTFVASRNDKYYGFVFKLEYGRKNLLCLYDDK